MRYKNNIRPPFSLRSGRFSRARTNCLITRYVNITGCTVWYTPLSFKTLIINYLNISGTNSER